MAILKMSRFNLMVFEHDKEEILNVLQNFKQVDFSQTDIKDLGYENFVSKNIDEIDENIIKLDQSIKKLKKYENSKGALKSLKKDKKHLHIQNLHLLQIIMIGRQ